MRASGPQLRRGPRRHTLVGIGLVIGAIVRGAIVSRARRRHTGLQQLHVLTIALLTMAPLTMRTATALDVQGVNIGHTARPVRIGRNNIYFRRLAATYFTAYGGKKSEVVEVATIFD